MHHAWEARRTSMAFSSTSSTSVIMRTEERAFARLLSRAFTPGVWREGAAERTSASIPTSWKKKKKKRDGEEECNIAVKRKEEREEKE